MRGMMVTWLALALVLATCAHPSTSGTATARNAITQEQLASTRTDNLYDAINKIHPEWLSSRGPTSVTDETPTLASVYMNGTMLGKANYLRDMRVLDVSEVRYWSTGQASARFGMGHPRGVIELTRK